MNDSRCMTNRQFYVGSYILRSSSNSTWLPGSVCICQWHAMRLLFNFYCDTSIRTSYSLADWQASEEGWEGEDPLPPPIRYTCGVFQELNAREKQRSYQPFYRALTAHWAMVENAVGCKSSCLSFARPSG